jgi:hypothetical protein
VSSRRLLLPSLLLQLWMAIQQLLLLLLQLASL